MVSYCPHLRKGMEAGALGERFEKLIDKSYKNVIFFFYKCVEKECASSGTAQRAGAAENPADTGGALSLWSRSGELSR